jgi:hypothetical protein
MLLREKDTLINTKYNSIVMVSPKEYKPATQFDLIEGVLILIFRRINLYRKWFILWLEVIYIVNVGNSEC